MKCVKYKIKPHIRHVTLAPIGDFHIGHKACQKQKLEQDLKYITQHGYYVIIMGDLLDNILPIIKPEYYYQPEVDIEMSDMKTALNYVQWLLLPLKERLIGIHMGNHDFDFIRKTQFNYIEHLCEKLHCHNLEFEAFINLQIRHQSYIIYSTHGHYIGRRTGGKINRLEDLSGFFDADIYLMGHTHELAGWRRVLLSMFADKQVTRKKIYALTGSYLLSHGEISTYAERHGYLPNKIGMLSITIDTQKNDMHIKE